MSWLNNISSYMNRVGQSVRNGMSVARDEATYYAKKAVYATKSGYKEYYNSLGWNDAAEKFGMAKAEGYKRAVEGGMIAAGRVGKTVAKKVVPGLNAAFMMKDVYTFGKGFARGWAAYGR